MTLKTLVSRLHWEKRSRSDQHQQARVLQPQESDALKREGVFSSDAGGLIPAGDF
jgi:hypothetical protein